jgi:hypothetical protein
MGKLMGRSKACYALHWQSAMRSWYACAGPLLNHHCGLEQRFLEVPYILFASTPAQQAGVEAK